MLQVIADHLSVEEVEIIKDMFTLMDTDRDGRVTYEELKAGLRKVGSQLAEPEIKMLMEVVSFYNCLLFIMELLRIVSVLCIRVCIFIMSRAELSCNEDFLYPIYPTASMCGHMHECDLPGRVGACVDNIILYMELF